jgi:hypothetical protein
LLRVNNSLFPHKFLIRKLIKIKFMNILKNILKIFFKLYDYRKRIKLEPPVKTIFMKKFIIILILKNYIYIEFVTRQNLIIFIKFLIFVLEINK